MKLNLFFAGVLTLLCSAQVLAFDQQGMSCGNGGAGWWLKLDFPRHVITHTGGISTSSGQYYGCGSCADCRKSLNAAIDSRLNWDRSNCGQKGGVSKFEDRGIWQEEVATESWRMTSTNVGIVCEKWIPCNL